MSIRTFIPSTFLMRILAEVDYFGPDSFEAVEKILTEEDISFELPEWNYTCFPDSKKTHRYTLAFWIQKGRDGQWTCSISRYEPGNGPENGSRSIPRYTFQLRGSHPDRTEAFLQAFVQLAPYYCPKLSEAELRSIGVSFLYRFYRQELPSIKVPEDLVDFDLKMFQRLDPEFQRKNMIEVRIKDLELEIESYQKKIVSAQENINRLQLERT